MRDGVTQPLLLDWSHSDAISTLLPLKATPYLKMVWMPLVRISVSYCLFQIWRSAVLAGSFSFPRAFMLLFPEKDGKI